MDKPTLNAALCQQHREINVDSGWWAGKYQAWPSLLSAKGIFVTQFTFSGFWSQGDGASFTGHLDMVPFLAAHPALAERFPANARLIRAHPEDWEATLMRTGHHYAHENTVGIEINVSVRDVDDVIMQAVLEGLRKTAECEEEAFDSEVLAICRGYMRDFYDDLEAEYEHLTDDEGVWETIVANNLHLEEA